MQLNGKLCPNIEGNSEYARQYGLAIDAEIVVLWCMDMTMTRVRARHKNSVDDSASKNPNDLHKIFESVLYRVLGMCAILQVTVMSIKTRPSFLLL
jgi:hypothetical protein